MPFNLPARWEDAPKSATHYYVPAHARNTGWWIKATNQTQWYYANGGWFHWPKPENRNAVNEFVPRPIPDRQEGVKMFRVNDIKHTVAYAQLHMAVAAYVAKKNEDRQFVRQAEQDLKTQLTLRFLRNLDRVHVGPEKPKFAADFDVDQAFNWRDSPEGHLFWHSIHHNNALDNLAPKPGERVNAVAGAGVAGPKKAEEPPKPKKVGWW